MTEKELGMLWEVFGYLDGRYKLRWWERHLLTRKLRNLLERLESELET